jgi:hypothetical protein
LASEKIAGKTREAPVSIGKGMNFNEAVAEPHGDFVSGIGLMFDPISSIVDSLLQPHMYEQIKPACTYIYEQGTGTRLAG